MALRQRLCYTDFVHSPDSLITFDTFNQSRHLFAFDRIVYDVKILYDLEGKDTESFANLCNEVLGRGRTADYRALSERLNSYKKSYDSTKIEWSKFPLSKLVPPHLANALSKERQSLVEELFNNAKEKEFYKSFYPVLKCLLNLSGAPLYIDLESIKDDNSHFSNLIRTSVRYGELYLHFNPVGAKTGRLSFKKGTVNFYILPRELRRCLIAPPDYSIVQMDYKSFQPRLAIYCTDDEEFKKKFAEVEDIYSVFPGDREENKLAFISWMFSKRRHPVFEDEARPILNLRKELYSCVLRDNKVTNKFGRTLHHSEEEDNVVFQNYITSTEVDVILTIMVKIYSFLKDKKSRIIFPFHDSIVFYIHKDEQYLLKDIQEIMENEHRSLFGARLPISVKSGPNFENLT